MDYKTLGGKAMEHCQCTQQSCQKVEEFDLWLSTLRMRDIREVLAIFNWEYEFREIPGFTDELDDWFCTIQKN